MDLKKFYEQCESGEKICENEVINYIKSYKTIILWGGSYLGKAVGKRLIELGVSITEYWDVRKDELLTVNNIKVSKPFENEYIREETLIIYCIGNHVISGGLINELKQNNYNNILRGDILYQGIICKYRKGMHLSAEQCWGSSECRPLVCKKAANIVKSCNIIEKPGERIDLQYIAFVINNICNLNCKYCIQYVNNYEDKYKGNVPLKTLYEDVDKFFDTVDSVGAITVMGGETFLHPDLGKFIKKLCTKPNFGSISIASNGLVPIKREVLECITDPRVAINFGYYLHVATEKEKEIYYKNLELVKSYGITVTESIKLPRWTVPPTMYKLDVDKEYMINRKQRCTMPPRDLQIKNNKVHVCDLSLAMHNMGRVDFKNDYLDLSEEMTLAERRQALRELIDRPYYETCGYCNSCGKDAGEGGLQGKWNIFEKEN